MSSEAIVRAFHAARPGATKAALARAGSYERLWARVEEGVRLDAHGEAGERRLDAHGEAGERRLDAHGEAGERRLDARILDLACGDHPMPGAIACDLSREELAGARSSGPRVQGRAQALPFSDGAFDAALCHLAFMLFDDIEAVVAELHRVLAPGGTFHALLGGGPVADGPDAEADAFHVFAQLMPRAAPLGDPRSKSETGWRGLFAGARDGAGRSPFAASRGWSEPVFERWELDLSGNFDDVWLFVGGAYQLREADRVRTELRARFPTDPVPCKVAAYYARITRNACITR